LIFGVAELSHEFTIHVCVET